MILEKIKEIKKIIGPKKLVVVSKNRTIEEVLDAYNTGHRDFGENRVQELVRKHEQLPKDIKWHMIGHLQKNKIKHIIPFVDLIHSVDSIELLEKINFISKKQEKVTNCLIQIKIAQEESKFGMSKSSFKMITENKNKYSFIKIKGVMGMASASLNEKKIKEEFDTLNQIYLDSPNCEILCMGMSQDYKIANKSGSNMFRIGSYIFS